MNKNFAATTQIAGRSLDLAEIVFITDTNFKLLKPEWLSDDDLMLKLKAYIFEIIETNEDLLAIDCFDHLHNLLAQNSRLAKERPDIFLEYLRMLALLKATFLMNLPEQDVMTFFRENLLFCLDVQDFDLGEKIFRLLFLYHKDPKVFEDERKQIQQAIEDNGEFLGENGITLLNKNEEQYATVENWLEDYNEFSVGFTVKNGRGAQTRASGGLGGSLERVSYMQKSLNVRGLNKDEKVILFKLLELYDWLKSLKPTTLFYEPFFSSYIETQNQALKLFNEDGENTSFVSNQSALGKPVEISSDLSKSVPPAVPESKSAKVMLQMSQVNVEEVLRKQMQSSGAGLRMGGGREITNNKLQIPNGEQGATGQIANEKLKIPNGEQGKGANDGQGVVNIEQATGNRGQADNKKTAPFGAALGFQQVPESPALTSEKSITESQSLSSGGPKGNRTPETRMSKPGSAPAWAHSDELYHSSAENMIEMTNMTNTKAGVPSKAQEIDRKLEDLEKRVKI